MFGNALHMNGSFWWSAIAEIPLLYQLYAIIVQLWWDFTCYINTIRFTYADNDDDDDDVVVVVEYTRALPTGI